MTLIWHWRLFWLENKNTFSQSTGVVFLKPVLFNCFKEVSCINHVHEVDLYVSLCIKQKSHEILISRETNSGFNYLWVRFHDKANAYFLFFQCYPSRFRIFSRLRIWTLNVQTKACYLPVDQLWNKNKLICLMWIEPSLYY